MYNPAWSRNPCKSIGMKIHGNGMESYLQNDLSESPITEWLVNPKHIARAFKTDKRGPWRQKHVSQAWINNCIPQNTVECNYLSLPEISASGINFLICLMRYAKGMLKATISMILICVLFNESELLRIFVASGTRGCCFDKILWL